jgi:hypothetical protein
MRSVVAVAVAGLSIGCAGTCSNGRSTADRAQNPSNALGRSRPSADAPPEHIAAASYGDSFPRLDAVPAGLGGKPFAPNELRLVVQPETSALPFAKRLQSEQPGLVVIVYPSSLDADVKEKAWLEKSGLPRFEDYGDFRETLEALAKDPKLGNYLSQVTTPWPSMAIADGVARERESACLFHGPWLVWAGSTADAGYPMRQAARGAWSRKALDSYESVREEINAHAKALFAKRADLSKQIVKRILERPDAQPQRLLDLAQGLSFTLQDREDLAFAYRLADRAVKDTEGLEFSVLRDAAFVHHLTGDPKGARGFLERALVLCKELQDDCRQIEGNLAEWMRCPWQLVELDPPLDMGWLVHFRLEPQPGTPADCKPKY